MEQADIRISVVVAAARGLKNKDLPFFGKNDAYATVRVGEQVTRTKTLRNAGEAGRWNEKFQFEATPESEIIVQVFDEDTFSSDLIGEVKLTTLLLYEEGFMESWFALTKGEKPRGEIHLSFQRIP